jgi:hypothetical protein
MSTSSASPTIDLAFPCAWSVEILPARPPILPTRCYVYPRDAEEIERGALELLIRAATPDARPFLGTCALGFRDPIVPTGVWSCPNPDEICAVSGGYAYMIHSAAPERFTMLPFRPVLEVRVLREQGMLLFVGHRSLLSWNSEGLAWQSANLSDEGITITAIEGQTLHGLGWSMMTDKETPFVLDLRTGQRAAAIE